MNKGERMIPSYLEIIAIAVTACEHIIAAYGFPQFFNWYTLQLLLTSHDIPEESVKISNMFQTGQHQSDFPLISTTSKNRIGDDATPATFPPCLSQSIADIICTPIKVVMPARIVWG